MDLWGQNQISLTGFDVERSSEIAKGTSPWGGRYVKATWNL
jgi:hypothetical protein